MRCSVALGTYNGSAYLASQLDSILAQTRPVDEIVVSDDASSDDTLTIIRNCAAAHPEIRWIILTAQTNQGFRQNFRRALSNCSGDLILLCDQDDIWVPQRVERLEQLFNAHPQMLTLITDFKTIDAQGNLLNPSAKTENLWVSDRVLNAKEKPAKISLREMLGRNQGQGCTMALRKEIAEEYAALNQVWTHDWIINLIAAMHGGLYYYDEQLTYYRLHDSNVIGMAQGEHAQRRIGFVRKLYEFALAFKYSLIEGRAEEAHLSLLSVTMDKYEFVFEHVACSGEELRQLQEWKAFQSKRLTLIEKKKLFAYILFFLKNKQLFAENAYFSTYEQLIIRLMLDLCAIVKA